MASAARSKLDAEQASTTQTCGCGICGDTINTCCGACGSCFGAVWSCFVKTLCCRWPYDRNRYPWWWIIITTLMLSFSFILLLIVYLPWEFVAITRPKRRHDKYDQLIWQDANPKHPHSAYRGYNPAAHHNIRNLWPARGEDVTLVDMTWDLYGVAKEIWASFRRQGLQYIGIIASVIMIIMQFEMLFHDSLSNNVTQYIEAIGDDTGEQSDQLTTDSACAYATGTGIANWGYEFEGVVYYWLYHIGLITLNFMVVLDELLNVRVGLFAPQWTRAGNGYTLMFLSAATVSTSANWGIKALIPLRYGVIVVIFFIGIYNVLKGTFATMGRMGSRSKREGYRVNRFPLRYWRGEFHPEVDPFDPTKVRPEIETIDQRIQKGSKSDERFGEVGERTFRRTTLPRMNFRAAPKEELVTVREKVGDNPDGTPQWITEEHNLRYRSFWTERLQYYIGDFSWPHERLGYEEIERRGKNSRKKWKHTKRHTDYARVQDKDLIEAWDLTGNKLERGFWHGGPIELPLLRWTGDYQKIERSKGKPHEKSEAKRYFGLPNWQPVTDGWILRLFDIRRLYDFACGLAMFGVQVALIWNGLAWSKWAAYRSEYSTAATSWDANGGPIDSDCSYYSQSVVPIYVLVSSSQYKVVVAAVFFLGIWHITLMGMCTAVMFVAWSNNRFYGMHCTIPFVTLIGPRLSSNSIGITLGFVALSTLQLGFFNGQPSGLWIARLVCYACLVAFIIHIAPNEPMRNVIIRDPFVEKHVHLSTWAVDYMDQQAHHREAFDDHHELRKWIPHMVEDVK